MNTQGKTQQRVQASTNTGTQTREKRDKREKGSDVCAISAKSAKRSGGLSECVHSALADPDGVSAALLEYGRLSGYPAGGCPPVKVKEGKRAWVSAISLARPLDMGLAWDRIEQSGSWDRYELPDAIEGIARVAMHALVDLEAVGATALVGVGSDGHLTLRVLWPEGARTDALDARVRENAADIRKALVWRGNADVAQ